jgi:hypothetical protein
MKPKRIRTKRLFNALNKYFFVKAQNGGMFSSTAQKEAITNAVITAAQAPAEKYRVVIAPGTIFLTHGTRTHQISKQEHFYYKPRKGNLL